jgi:hypothetical protein
VAGSLVSFMWIPLTEVCGWFQLPLWASLGIPQDPKMADCQWPLATDRSTEVCGFD